MTAEGWLPSEGEVHVRIWLSGAVLDYTATSAVVRNLIDDWNRKRWCAIEFVRDAIDDGRLLPRLPCQQLFLGP